LVTSPVLQPATCAQQIEKYRVTHTFANNELLDKILSEKGDSPQSFSSLKLAGFASFAPSLEDLPERAEKAGVTLVGLYGSSELQALVAGRRPSDDKARYRAGGQLVAPDARVRARDSSTGRILPHGEVGELEIQAPSLMREYLDDPDENTIAIDGDGYFRTGDLGYTEADNQFTFLARKGDFLRLSGFLVNPLEIENFIEGMEHVAACQVVAAPMGGKAVPVAFVITDNQGVIDEHQVITACKQAMAGFKVPKRVLVLESFPVVQSANSNKIQRGKLQEIAIQAL